MIKPTECFTWKNAAYAGVAALILLGSTAVGLDNKHVSLDRYESMEDDIRIIKKCLIEKKCGG